MYRALQWSLVSSPGCTMVDGWASMGGWWRGGALRALLLHAQAATRLTLPLPVAAFHLQAQASTVLLLLGTNIGATVQVGQSASSAVEAQWPGQASWWTSNSGTWPMVIFSECRAGPSLVSAGQGRFWREQGRVTFGGCRAGSSTVLLNLKCRAGAGPGLCLLAGDAKGLHVPVCRGHGHAVTVRQAAAW